MTTSCDIAVIGGGLAGSSFATHLASRGRDVLLLERTTEPHHKVCGEFLSHEALTYLHQLGIDIPALGGFPITHVRLFRHTLIAAAPLPFPAASLTRRCLDEALLTHAAHAGVRVQRGTHVQSIHATQSIHTTPGSHTVEIRQGTPVTARTVVLATGKHDLHNHGRPAGRHTGLVGFKMYFALTAAQQAELGNAVELHLFPGGYAGLQPVEGGHSNLCLLIRSDRLPRTGPAWPHLQQHLASSAPTLARRLHGATALLPAPLTVARIPYGFLQPGSPDGLWRIGDQAAVIPSFSGDGMSIALHSAALAAHSIAAGIGADSFQRSLAHQLRWPMRLATATSLLLVQQPWLALAAHLLPSLLSQIASMTRIPNSALLTQQ